MRAIVQDTYGSADVLRLEEIERPSIGDDELLVRVHAAGVDAGVWHVMTGLPYMIRIMGYGLRGPKSRVRGSDLAGRVEAVGSKVTRFRSGDDVFGACDGSFAEYASVKEKNCAPKPVNLTFEQAAAVPVSGLTALQGIRDHGKVEVGQQVLVTGAGGGVGTFAVQIARALGSEVAGVCSTAKVDTVRAIGAAKVIDYTREDFADSGHRWDLILDTGGNRSLSHLRGVLTPRGTLVIVGGEGGDRWIGGTDRQLRALVLSPFVRHNLRTFVARILQEDLLFLKQLIEAGKVTPVIDKAYPLSQASDAVRHLAERRARGKVVITV